MQSEYRRFKTTPNFWPTMLFTVCLLCEGLERLCTKRIPNSVPKIFFKKGAELFNLPSANGIQETQTFTSHLLSCSVTPLPQDEEPCTHKALHGSGHAVH